jgi:hypothetical protein
MDDLTSRNFQAVKQAVDMLGGKLDEERTKRMALELQIAMLNEQVSHLTQSLAIMRFNQMGRGPTSQG